MRAACIALLSVGLPSVGLLSIACETPLSSRDAGPLDAGPLDAGAPEAGLDASVDADRDSGTDAGPPPLDPIEITAPSPLLGPVGALIAHGWARHPHMQYDRSAVRADLADRVREWEYYAVYAPDFALSVTLTDIGLLTLGTLSVQDYASGEVVSETLLGGRGELALPPTPFESTSWPRSDGLVELLYAAGLRTVRFRAGADGVFERADAELEVLDDPAGESIAVVTRFAEDPGLFFYENKRVALPATGRVRLGARTWTLPASGAFAVIDWGRGAWPADVHWDWAAGGGTSGGHRVGINLGSVHGDDSRGTADAVIVDGVLHKIDRVFWDFDPEDPSRPWRFTSMDGRLDLTLAPDFDESSMIALGPRHSMRTLKMHGTFSGTVELDDGSVLAIDGVRGAAEHVLIRW